MGGIEPWTSGLTARRANVRAVWLWFRQECRQTFPLHRCVVDGKRQRLETCYSKLREAR